jgi:hypothetical protein
MCLTSRMDEIHLGDAFEFDTTGLGNAFAAQKGVSQLRRAVGLRLSIGRAKMYPGV